MAEFQDFSTYSSSAEWVDEDKTSSSALSEANVEGLAVVGSAHFTGLKKEDMEEGPAVELLPADVEGPAVAGIWVMFLQGFQSFFDIPKTFSKSFDVQATHRFFFTGFFYPAVSRKLTGF
ncbi:hypothetical protein E2C01_046272 [Portunus trituberculatus]|uniref:Uncharacterized protein n=1 Tax=Portunus trituberculatus TaxID=210409 RepID=A0A5B7G7B3_PORTR|nr:hypothetical protein [Portunus trituberculatus]